MRGYLFGRKKRYLFVLLFGVAIVFIKFRIHTNVLEQKNFEGRVPRVPNDGPVIGAHNEVFADHEAKEVFHKNGLGKQEIPDAANRRDIVDAKGSESSGNFIGLQNSNFKKIVNPPGHKPTILIWAGQFGSHIQYLANPEVCGGDVDCDITYDRSRLGESGALVFHYTGAGTVHSVPGPRDPRKLYLWWTLEKNHGSSLTEFDNVFNLTFSYRTDSGIYAPYGSTNLILDELRKAGEYEIEPLMEKKRQSGKIAAWAVSNCGVRRRNDLVQQMIDNGFGIERFGRCYGGRKIGDGAYSDTFYEALSHYKFYMALENGHHCKDYMTEKFWFNGLRAGTVPIVMGAKKEDVAKVAPKNSFIYANDFPDVPSLVKYLNYLSENETAYREYLEWRRWAKNPDLVEERLRPKNKDNDLRSFCKLCRVLQEEEEADRMGLPRRKMLVPSLHDFWWTNENPECMSG